MASGQRFGSAKYALAELAVILMFGITLWAQQVFDGPVTTRNGNLYMTTEDSTCCAPEIHFQAIHGSWLMGIDVANPPQGQDFVPVAKIEYCKPSNPNDCNPFQTDTYTEYDVDDLIYVHNGGVDPPTVGIGVTPPNELNRLQVTAEDDFPSMGTLLLRRTPHQTGHVLTMTNGLGTTEYYVDSQFNTFTNGSIYANGTIHAVGGVSTGGTLAVGGIVSTNGTTELKIDHPLDPANKYLHHAGVESSDMMNIYSGNVVLNQSGEAEVDLPAWFEALNENFRYQLTCIGGSAPVYISQEVHNNRFRIAGGRAGLKVSWQLTATRHDAYAQAHQSPVEEEKPLAERGTYLHPELYGGSAAPMTSAGRLGKSVQR